MTAILYIIVWALAGALVSLVIVRCFQYLNEPDIDAQDHDEQAKPTTADGYYTARRVSAAIQQHQKGQP